MHSPRTARSPGSLECIAETKSRKIAGVRFCLNPAGTLTPAFLPLDSLAVTSIASGPRAAPGDKKVPFKSRQSFLLSVSGLWGNPDHLSSSKACVRACGSNKLLLFARCIQPEGYFGREPERPIANSLANRRRDVPNE